MAAGGHQPTSGWARLGNWVAGRPWWVLIATLAVLAALAAPASALKVGPLDDGYGDRGTEPQVSRDGRAVLVQALPDYAPSDPRALDVVKRVRAIEMPGVQVHVGGKVAGLADAGDRIMGRTPLVVAIVVLLSALLLLVAFRAPLVAVKAALMNLVSLGAAFGALAVAFSFGPFGESAGG